MSEPQPRPDSFRLREMARSSVDPVVRQALLNLADDCELAEEPQRRRA